MTVLPVALCSAFLLGPAHAAQEPASTTSRESVEALVRELPDVRVEERGGWLAVVGWTNGATERAHLDRLLGYAPGVLDLTTGEIADPDRMVEVDVVIFLLRGLKSTSKGFDFLRLINVSYEYFSADNRRAGTGLQAPGALGDVTSKSQQGWAFGASVDYDVNIANATDLTVSVLARPHLTTLNGTPAEFQAGGEIVFQVSGIESGDIKPYPFGLQMLVTPTVLKRPNARGEPQVRIEAEISRSSILGILFTGSQGGLIDDVVFDTAKVSSQALLGFNETLILSGVYQRETQERESGVPYLRKVPVLENFFSNEALAEDLQTAVILITPREPELVNENRREALEEFVERRRKFSEALDEGPEAVDRFLKENPQWSTIAPNRYASHFFLMNNSEIYRRIHGEDLATEALDLKVVD